MAKAETGGHAEPEFSVVAAPSPTVSMGMLEEDPDLKFAFSKNGAVREVYCYKDTPLFDFNEVRKWFEGNRPSVSYKRHGLLYLGEFCRYVNKSPRQLIDERRKRLRKDPGALLEEEWLDRWHQRVIGNGLKKSTAQGKFSKIVSFFDCNRSKLNIPRFPQVTADEYHGPKRLRREEIQKMISFSDSLRTKLLLVVGPESGLRTRALAILCLGHLVREEDGTKEGIPVKSREDLAGVTLPCRIQLPRKFYFGRKREGIAFLCKDAVKMLDEALRQRQALGEPITASTPLFPTYRAVVRTLDLNARVSTYLSEYRPVGARIRIRQRRPPGPKGVPTEVEAIVEQIFVNHADFSTLEKMMKDLREKASIGHNSDEESPASVSSLRKYLHSTLDVAGLNAHMVNVIIGHSNSIAEHYSGKRHLDINEVRKSYESAMSRISITEDPAGPRVFKLEEKVQELESYSKTLEERLMEYAPVKDKLVELQVQVQSLLRQNRNP